MNGKEQIAAVLAHEVKNPVSLIKMNVQYIKDFCPKALENNFTVIEKELEKLNHIINDYTIMAENTRKENIEMIFIDELLSDIIEEYNLTPYDKKIEFVLDSPDDVKLYGDYNKINILFFNIYKNAIEAINNKINQDASLTDKKIALSVELVTKNAWENSLVTQLDEIPFHYVGKGEQCVVKTELALAKRTSQNASIILLCPHGILKMICKSSPSRERFVSVQLF